MKPGDVLTTTRPIRSQKTGVVLPRQGIFVSAIENLGRQLILVNFGKVGLEYLFPNEILAQSPGVNESFSASYSQDLIRPFTYPQPLQLLDQPLAAQA